MTNWQTLKLLLAFEQSSSKSLQTRFHWKSLRWVVYGVLLLLTWLFSEVLYAASYFLTVMTIQWLIIAFFSSTIANSTSQSFDDIWVTFPVSRFLLLLSRVLQPLLAALQWLPFFFIATSLFTVIMISTHPTQPHVSLVSSVFSGIAFLPFIFTLTPSHHWSFQRNAQSKLSLSSKNILFLILSTFFIGGLGGRLFIDLSSPSLYATTIIPLLLFISGVLLLTALFAYEWYQLLRKPPKTSKSKARSSREIPALSPFWIHRLANATSSVRALWLMHRHRDRFIGKSIPLWRPLLLAVLCLAGILSGLIFHTQPNLFIFPILMTVVACYCLILFSVLQILRNIIQLIALFPVQRSSLLWMMVVNAWLRLVVLFIVPLLCYIGSLWLAALFHHTAQDTLFLTLVTILREGILLLFLAWLYLCLYQWSYFALEWLFVVVSILPGVIFTGYLILNKTLYFHDVFHLFFPATWASFQSTWPLWSYLFIGTIVICVTLLPILLSKGAQNFHKKLMPSQVANRQLKLGLGSKSGYNESRM